ncbi:MAG: hypothetical protein PVG39_07965 [Desulfobacteraceae bacterium]|jgi:hypothetical protein
MNIDTMIRGCPWGVVIRDEVHCKALVGQPNGSKCLGHKCAAIYMAELMLNIVMNRLEAKSVNTPSAKEASETN